MESRTDKWRLLIRWPFDTSARHNTPLLYWFHNRVYCFNFSLRPYRWNLPCPRKQDPVRSLAVIEGRRVVRLRLFRILPLRQSGLKNSYTPKDPLVDLVTNPLMRNCFPTLFLLLSSVEASRIVARLAMRSKRNIPFIIICSTMSCFNVIRSWLPKVKLWIQSERARKRLSLEDWCYEKSVVMRFIFNCRMSCWVAGLLDGKFSGKFIRILNRWIDGDWNDKYDPVEFPW